MVGFGEYEVTYGTEFSVSLRPVEKYRNSIKKRDVVDKSYTYKIKPGVIKKDN